MFVAMNATAKGVCSSLATSVVGLLVSETDILLGERPVSISIEAGFSLFATTSLAQMAEWYRTSVS